MKNLVLAIKSLKIAFQKKEGFATVVNNLNIEVFAGRTLAIVGESGSGKSVSSLSILQLLNKQQSRIAGDVTFYNGQEPINLLRLNENSVNEIRGKGISMIFQEPMAALNPVLRCGEQVAEMISTHQPELAKKQVSELVLSLFNEVELPRPEKMMDSFPHQLSGGQQQRVMIAMALANKPLVLIADEPTTALDPQVQDGIIDLLKRLQAKNGMAIIFISHDLDAVQKIADDIVVMQNGEVLESGLASKVLKHPQHPYTKGLLNCKPGSDKKGFRLPTVKNYLENPDFVPVKKPTKNIQANQMLAVKNLSVVYTSGGLFAKKKQVAALDNVNIELFKGETLGIIGPSGCGKTTLGRVIAGWIKPTSGEVTLQSATRITPTMKPGKDWAREVQLIFQDPFGSLNPKIKIGAAIAEPMLVHGLAKNKKEAQEAVEQLLEKVGLLPEHFDRYPHEFSGGQRQRIVIARALAVKPKILICDESVAALDVSVQAQVLNLLNDLQEEFALSYIFISHDHNVIHYFCDRIVQMEMGKIKDTKSAESITPQVEELITHKKPKETPEKPAVIATTGVPDETLADQVSSDLLKLRLAQSHKKLERLANQIHIPVVLDELETEPTPVPESDPEVVEAITPPTPAPIQEVPERVAEPKNEPVVVEVKALEEVTPAAPPPPSYKSLSDFIKSNKA